jgi:hypothetical protein
MKKMNIIVEPNEKLESPWKEDTISYAKWGLDEAYYYIRDFEDNFEVRQHVRERRVYFEENGKRYSRQGHYIQFSGPPRQLAVVLEELKRHDFSCGNRYLPVNPKSGEKSWNWIKDFCKEHNPIYYKTVYEPVLSKTSDDDPFAVL